MATPTLINSKLNHVANQLVFKITSVQNLVLKFKNFLTKYFKQDFVHLKIRAHTFIIQSRKTASSCRRYGGQGAVPLTTAYPPDFGLLCFLEHAQDFLVVDSYATRGKEQKSLQPPLAKSFRKCNLKKQVFKRIWT